MIPQFVPYWGDAEANAVSKVLQSDYLNEHKTVREFEKEFACFVGAKYCTAVTSGTVALYCSIKAASIRTAAVPTHDGIFAFNALIGAGAKPSVLDVNKDGLLAVSGEKIVVHANGRISTDVSVIEDCSQAISHHTAGQISTYSFASTKHITTGGQGGAICCDSQEMFDDLVRLKDHGRNDRQSLRPMSDNYDSWGLNFKLTEMQAAFGLAQLRSLKARLDRLNQIYSIYRDVLDKMVSFGESPGWYVDVFTPHASKIYNSLKKHQIHCRRYPRPLHMQKIASGYCQGSFENSEHRYSEGLYLPSTTNLSDEDVKRIAGEIINAISS